MPTAVAAWRTNHTGMDFRACDACGAVGRLQTTVDEHGRDLHVDIDRDGYRAVCGLIQRYRVRAPLGGAPRTWVPPSGFYSWHGDSDEYQ
jgi:hypothetical protein